MESTPSCAVCGLVLSGRCAQVGDKHYHVDCMTCSRCSNRLDGGGCQGPGGFLCQACSDEFQALLKESEQCIQNGDEEQANAILGQLQAFVGTKVPDSSVACHGKADHDQEAQQVITSAGAEEGCSPAETPKALLGEAGNKAAPKDDQATASDPTSLCRSEVPRSSLPAGGGLPKAEAKAKGKAKAKAQSALVSAGRNLVKQKAQIASPGESASSASRATATQTQDSFDKEHVLAFFKDCDLDANGKIEKKELAKVFQFLDAAMWTDKAIDRLFEAMDVEKEGAIDQHQFVNWMCNAKGALRTKCGSTFESLPRWTELVQKEAAEAARALEQAMEREAERLALMEPHERRADACATICRGITSKYLNEWNGYYFIGQHNPTVSTRIHWTALVQVLVLMCGETTDLGWGPPVFDGPLFPEFKFLTLQLSIQLIHYYAVERWMQCSDFKQTVFGVLLDLDHNELEKKLVAGGSKVREIAILLAFPFFGKDLALPPSPTGDTNYGTKSKARMYPDGENVTRRLAEWLQAGVRPVIPKEIMADAEKQLREAELIDDKGKPSDFQLSATSVSLVEFKA